MAPMYYKNDRKTFLKMSNNNDFRPFSRPRNPTIKSKCGSQCGKMTQSSIPSHKWSIFVVKKSKEKNEK